MRKFLSLLAAILFAGSMLAAVGNVFYTFVPQKLGSGNVSDYSKSGDQEIDGLTWTVPGNWYGTGALRLGGKSIENVDRSIIGKSAIGDAIAKIVISHAGINSTDLVLNTVKLTVASDAEFSADVETKTLTLNTDYTVEKDKAGTIEFTPAGDFWAKNSYYKFDFNFTNSNGSNRALTLNKIEFYSYSDVEITHWTVAGSSATLFGTTWEPANKDNEMIQQEDGSFKWEKTELELAKGTIAFKVCKNYTWDEAYPAKDYELAIPEGAIYTVTINFNPESKEIAAVATKTGEAVVLPTVVLHGNFTGEWKDTDPFAPAEDKLTARLNLTLAEGNYEFGFKFDGAWKANGANITREAPTTSLAEGSGNMHFAADAAGEYQLTYTFETQTLEVVYPKKPEVLPEGAFKLTFKGSGTDSDSGSEFKKDGDIFTDDCKALVASVDTISKVYAARVIEDDPSSLKFGTSSAKGYFEFTLATPVTVDSIIVNATQYGNNAAEVTINGVKFDLTAGNKKPQDCKLTPEGTVSTITIAQTGSERLYLRYITVYAKSTPTPPADPTVAVAGTMSEWAEIPFELSEDKKKATLFNDNIKAGTYEFKMVINKEWRSNGYEFHRGFPGCAGITGNTDANMKVVIDVEGAYTFEWYFENDSLAIIFPEKPEPVVNPIVETYFATGDGWAPDTESSAVWDAENQKVIVNIALDKVAQWQAQVKYQALASQPDKFYHFGVKMKANNNVKGITVKWDDNTGLVLENASIALEANTEFVMDLPQVASNAAGNGILVFDFGQAKKGDVIEIYDIVVEEVAAPVVELEDGFYVIGLHGWTIYDLTAADKFAANGEVEGEFVLNTTLAVGNEFKVVAVAENKLGAWYPAEAGNYVVDLAHAGEKAIYFRPNYDGGADWHAGCIFVPENVVPVSPIDHTYFATGDGWAADDESSAVWDPETGKITVTLALPKVAAWQGQVFINTVKAEVGKCYNFSVKMKSNKNLSGATIKWQENNNDPIMVSEINTISLVADEEFVYTKTQIAGQDGNGKLVYDFGFAEAGTVIEIYDLVIEETSCGAPEPVNFYLVGSMTDWKVVADEAHTFVANEANPGEYMLPATLAEGDQIKVVGVQGEKQTWYPEDYDGAYTVDAAHAGLVTIYFRPEGGVEGWHYGFFYVSEPTGIEEILSEGKAVKVLREGNILIMKGNHTYTVMGQIVK